MEPSTGKKGKINGIFSTTKGQFKGGNTTNFATLLESSHDGFLQTFKQVSEGQFLYLVFCPKTTS